ncbi:hypothetical protein [Alicyclobacillus fastidiosus]|uniref:Uncharacterized protein n=1 Tax=Alicyclobacillus fastidiosus TaxID=392011 RepID=A0ABV5ALH8_9BACL|nr:hypothetical protein [Alicyclobacillus fastidiosus]WEH11072.1 hypothetical protein PYS47_07600 [Alicyclobacillus fastidiosus]
MVSAVQLLAGNARIFKRGTGPTTRTRTVKLPVGEELVINEGFNDTIFVKSGTRPVRATRIREYLYAESDVDVLA